MAEHDWLEGVSVALGVLFLVIAVACVWGFAVAVTSLGDPEPDINAQPSVLAGSTQGAVEATRWFGIVLFAMEETDLRGPLRDGATDAELEKLIRTTVWRKWSGHRINHPDFVQPDRSMSAIGG